MSIIDHNLDKTMTKLLRLMLLIVNVSLYHPAILLQAFGIWCNSHISPCATEVLNLDTYQAARQMHK